MRKKFSSRFFLLITFTFCWGAMGLAQNNSILKFNKEGTFKIVQFTDTHVDLTKSANLQVFEIIPEVLKAENPDFVILTGDIVTQNDPQEAYTRLARIFQEAGVPWAMVFGNHDSEHNFSRKELAEFLQKLPFCLNVDKGETKGYSNFVLPVYGKENKPAAVLYCMDSNEYSTLKPLVGGWGWFTHSQVGWYREQSRKFTHSNHGKPLSALAFFHIPLPEYAQAWNNEQTPPVGVRNEDECSPEINTGMFAAMLECGDVMGTFAGHDHYNDYIGVSYNIALAYGRNTKPEKSSEEPLAGARVILLKELERKFDTWIRELNGNKVLECSWPGSFAETRKNL